MHLYLICILTASFDTLLQAGTQTPVLSVNCLLSSFGTSAVTRVVCEQSVHVFPAWFLQWFTDTNCLCYQVMKSSWLLLWPCQSIFFFYFNVSGKNNKETKAQFRSLCWQCHTLAFSWWEVDALYVSFCHHIVNIVFLPLWKWGRGVHWFKMHPEFSDDSVQTVNKWENFLLCSVFNNSCSNSFTKPKDAKNVFVDLKLISCV